LVFVVLDVGVRVKVGEVEGVGVLDCVRVVLGVGVALLVVLGVGVGVRVNVVVDVGVGVLDCVRVVLGVGVCVALRV
jgi:hypothetical protein